MKTKTKVRAGNLDILESAVVGPIAGMPGDFMVVEIGPGIGQGTTAIGPGIGQ